MADIVNIARMRREALCIEVETLDRFINTAKLLLRSRTGDLPGAMKGHQEAARIEPLRPSARAMPATRLPDPSRPGRAPLEAARKQPPTGTLATRPESLFTDWGQDTFEFEALATGLRP